jgi:hypothetical protein
MKSLILASVAFFAISCASQKEVTENTPIKKTEDRVAIPDNNQIDPNHTVGTVHLDPDGCGAYIEVLISGEEKKLLYPVNLEDSMKMEFNKIEFDYALSRAPIPSGCKVDMTVSVSNVKRLK